MQESQRRESLEAIRDSDNVEEAHRPDTQQETYPAGGVDSVIGAKPDSEGQERPEPQDEEEDQEEDSPESDTISVRGTRLDLGRQAVLESRAASGDFGDQQEEEDRGAPATRRPRVTKAERAELVATQNAERREKEAA